MATQSNSEESMEALSNQVVTLCPKCGNPMKNLGNVSGVVLASWPPQWNETLVCYTDKLKQTVHRTGSMIVKPDLEGFTEVTDLAATDQDTNTDSLKSAIESPKDYPEKKGSK